MTDEVPVDFLLEAVTLKDETRTGWELRGIDTPESVAAHTWGVGLLCLLFVGEAAADLDRERVLVLALVHDLAEARVGDVPVRAEDGAQPVTTEEKTRSEREAMGDFDAALPGIPLGEWWDEYEARETPEARFVKDMDLADNCLQALRYEMDGRYDATAENEHFTEYEALDEFFATAEPRIRTAVGRALFETIRDRYEAAKRGDA